MFDAGVSPLSIKIRLGRFFWASLSFDTVHTSKRRSLLCSSKLQYYFMPYCCLVEPITASSYLDYIVFSRSVRAMNISARAVQVGVGAEQRLHDQAGQHRAAREQRHPHRAAPEGGQRGVPRRLQGACMPSCPFACSRCCRCCC